MRLLTASPAANGFYGAKGVSGLIPTAYSLLEQHTWRSLHRAWNRRRGSSASGGGTTSGGTARRSLLEYSRPGWEFHAKGIWCMECSLLNIFLHHKMICVCHASGADFLPPSGSGMPTLWGIGRLMLRCGRPSVCSGGQSPRLWNHSSNHYTACRCAAERRASLCAGTRHRGSCCPSRRPWAAPTTATAPSCATWRPSSSSSPPTQPCGRRAPTPQHSHAFKPPAAFPMSAQNLL